jgi:co-chaperonin GroES (HSP10)
MAINVKPFGARVLVQLLEEKEVKKGGIIIHVEGNDPRQKVANEAIVVN